MGDHPNPAGPSTAKDVDRNQAASPKLVAFNSSIGASVLWRLGKLEEEYSMSSPYAKLNLLRAQTDNL